MRISPTCLCTAPTREFRATARLDRTREDWIPFVDNLFSAAELLAKANLLLVPDPSFRQRASHKLVHSRFNRFAALGNVAPEHRKTFNRLASLRPQMRYLKQPAAVTPKEAYALLKTVADMLRRQERMVGE